MITLLNSGYTNIIQLFYNNKTSRFHLREIARKTKLHEPSTTRFLKNLEKEQILKSEKDGNQKKYSIKNTKQAYLFFEALDIKKFEKLPNIRKNAVEIYYNNLPEKPIFAILFGSTAKETYKEDSDIDLLLITNKKIMVENAQKETDALTATKISAFQITYNQFLKELLLKEDKVIQSAIKTGYPIINHIKYYEALYNERI